MAINTHRSESRLKATNDALSKLASARESIKSLRTALDNYGIHLVELMGTDPRDDAAVARITKTCEVVREEIASLDLIIDQEDSLLLRREAQQATLERKAAQYPRLLKRHQERARRNGFQS